MENEEINLNTESNDIAGNRVGGPAGNTAAKPGLPNTGVGIPGGPPTPPSGQSAAAPPSSESLVASEMNAGNGAVEPAEQQENQEVNPNDLAANGTYGGNFSNSTQGSYRDQTRRDNQDSDPSRGEFGVQDSGGTTHGGFGNQNRLADYESHGSAEDQYYGGPGSPGPQDNAYRAYDGHDERPDNRSEYGFQAGGAVGNTSGQAADSGQPGAQGFSGPNGDNRNQPDRTDPNSAYQNDNGSVTGPDSGYASDYGHTSLRDAAASDVAPTSRTGSGADSNQRNQSEDYLPAQAGFDRKGRREENYPGYSTNDPEVADQRGQRLPDGQGYGDRGREEPRRAPDLHTGDDRNGYMQANGGDSAQGVGSQGGSYNDAYDDSKPGSKVGSPAQGELRQQDTEQNYGSTARRQNRAGDDSDDHGAPRRNAGRDGDGDE